MDKIEESFVKDTAHPCSYCGNFAFVESEMRTDKAIYLVVGGRSLGDMLKGRGKSKLKFLTCIRCGHLRVLATEIDKLLGREPVASELP